MPIIKTSVYSRIDWAMRQIAQRAGLGVFAALLGIGKIFAIKGTTRALEAEAIKVVAVTCTPSIEGNIGAFAKSVLAQFGVNEQTAVDRIDALETLVMGDPFGYPPRQSILVVDEAQGLRVPVLNMLRGIWDVGQPARETRSYGPVFGLLLCGNNTFLNRQGRVREMDFKPLKDRITLDLRLQASEDSELAEIAAEFCPHDDAAAKLLGKYGRSRGNIRSIATAYGEACGLANGDPVTVSHIKDAVTIIGGI